MTLGSSRFVELLVALKNARRIPYADLLSDLVLAGNAKTDAEAEAWMAAQLCAMPSCRQIRGHEGACAGGGMGGGGGLVLGGGLVGEISPTRR